MQVRLIEFENGAPVPAEPAEPVEEQTVYDNIESKVESKVESEMDETVLQAESEMDEMVLQAEMNKS